MDATKHVGKTCPYCQTPIKPGAPARVCAACGMPHHEECWRTNGGCTSFGCANGPRQGPRPAPPAVIPNAAPAIPGPAPGSVLTVQISPEASVPATAATPALPPALAPPEPPIFPALLPRQVADVLNRWSDRRLSYYNLGSLGERAEVLRQRDGAVYRVELSTLSRAVRYETRESPEPQGIPAAAGRRPWPLPVPTAEEFRSGVAEYVIEGSEQVIACPDCLGQGRGCARCAGSGRVRRWQTATVDDEATHEESLIGAESAPPEVVQALAAGEGFPLDDVSAPAILPEHIERWDQMDGWPAAVEIAARLRWLQDRLPPAPAGRTIILQRLRVTAAPYTVVDFRPQDVRAALAPALAGRIYLRHPARQPGEHRVVIFGRDRRVFPDLPAKRLTRFAPARAFLLAKLALAACLVLAVAAQSPWWVAASALAAWNAFLARTVMRRQRRLLAEKRAGTLRGRTRWRQWWDGVALPRLGYTAWSATAYAACAAALAGTTGGAPEVPALLPLLPSVLVAMGAVATSRPPRRERYR